MAFFVFVWSLCFLDFSVGVLCRGFCLRTESDLFLFVSCMIYCPRQQYIIHLAYMCTVMWESFKDISLGNKYQFSRMLSGSKWSNLCTVPWTSEMWSWFKVMTRCYICMDIKQIQFSSKKFRPWHTVWAVRQNAIDWWRWNIAKVCVVEVEIVTFVVERSAKLTVPSDQQK